MIVIKEGQQIWIQPDFWGVIKSIEKTISFHNLQELALFVTKASESELLDLAEINYFEMHNLFSVPKIKYCVWGVDLNFEINPGGFHLLLCNGNEELMHRGYYLLFGDCGGKLKLFFWSKLPEGTNIMHVFRPIFHDHARLEGGEELNLEGVDNFLEKLAIDRYFSIKY